MALKTFSYLQKLLHVSQLNHPRKALDKVNLYFSVFPQKNLNGQVLSPKTSTSHPRNKEFQSTEKERTSLNPFYEASIIWKTDQKKQSAGQSHTWKSTQKS